MGSLPMLKETIREGLRLFGLTEEHMTSIVGIPLTPAYAVKFVTQTTIAERELRVFLVGDAAISHHFWPGRGLNTGLKVRVLDIYMCIH